MATGTIDLIVNKSDGWVLAATNPTLGVTIKSNTPSEWCLALSADEETEPSNSLGEVHEGMSYWRSKGSLSGAVWVKCKNTQIHVFAITVEEGLEEE